MGRHVERRRWFGRGRTRALLSLCVLLGFGAVGTGAYWTDSATLATGSVDSGEMHIDLGSNVKAKPESVSFNLSATGTNALYPGKSIANTIAVTNNSTVTGLAFTYRVQASATGPLASALLLTVSRGGSASSGTCSGGTTLGSPNTAIAGFDQPAGEALTTAAGGPSSHTICIALKLDPSAGNGLQGQTGTVVTFTFPATQAP